MKSFISIVALVAAVAVAWMGYSVGQSVPFARQWPLYEALRSTASIIFAVIGAWFAIIYPEKLRSLKSQSVEDVSEQPGMNRLFTPIVHSTIILSLILIIGVIAPLLAHAHWAVEHKAALRGVSYSFLCLLTVWQVVTVLMTLDPADALKRRADDVKKQRNAVKAITGDRE